LIFLPIPTLLSVDRCIDNEDEEITCDSKNQKCQMHVENLVADKGCVPALDNDINNFEYRFYFKDNQSNHSTKDDTKIDYQCQIDKCNSEEVLEKVSLHLFWKCLI
jgi:hypothetical protein